MISTDLLTTAQWYLSLGFCVVPVQARGKAPVMTGWQKLRLTEAELPEAFTADSNIGLLLGEPSGGLVDVDLDCPEAIELAAEFLPPTECITGRGGKPRSHYWYIAPGAATRQFRDSKRSMLVELRSTGGQTVVGPSIHPDGDEYDVLQQRPAEVAYEKLLATVKAMADEILHRRGEQPKASAPAPAPAAVPAPSLDQPRSGPDLVARAAAYLRNVPPAVSGKGGHSQTFTAATALVHGFGLDQHSAFDLLKRVYNPTCEPPWTDRELDHKVKSAATTPHGKPFGYLRDATSTPRPSPASIPRASSMHRPSAGSSSPEGAAGGLAPVPDIDQSVAEEPGDRRRTDADGGAEAGGGPDTEDPGTPETGKPKLVALGRQDPNTGRFVLSPKHTLPSAHAFLRAFHNHEDCWTIVSFGGELLVWKDNRYRPLPEGGMEQKVQRWLNDCLRYQFNKRTDSYDLVTFESNPTTVKAVIQTIRADVTLPLGLGPTCWLEARDGDPPVRELLLTPSKVIHLPTLRLIDPTPRLFATSSIDFELDPDAPEPSQWLAFLDQCFAGDAERIRLLQQWFGYVLTSDTSQQKMLLIFGPRRSGKGTIGRVLAKVVGLGNIASPTVSSLAESFGLQPLLGKSLAIVSDARFSGQHISTVVERLLLISGEDPVSVSRKHTSAVETTLPTRFMFMTNELPRLADASAALPGRMLPLETQQSFFGREDTALTDKLQRELPGILNWAIEGWRDLQAVGRFTEPQASHQAAQELEDLASPVLQFVRERCELGRSERVVLDTLYAAWQEWCRQSGREVVSNKQMFGRDLRAAVPSIERLRGTNNVGIYRGISLRSGRAG